MAATGLHCRTSACVCAPRSPITSNCDAFISRYFTADPVRTQFLAGRAVTRVCGGNHIGPGGQSVGGYYLRDSEMTCEVEEKKGVVHIRGEMTIYGAALLKEQFLTVAESQTKKCTVDLAEVSEIDTTGLQMLLIAHRDCVARGVKFALANPSGVVRETLDLLKINDLPVATRSVRP
jgi:anti-anti-sigma factor